MNWLQWSASIVESLAWPSSALLIALVFRSQIKDLLSKIRKLSWGDASADFSEELDKLESSGRQLEYNITSEDEEAEPIHDGRFERMLLISPAGAVLDAWKPIQKQLEEISFVRFSQIKQKRHYTPQQAALMLYKEGYITESDFHLINEMRNLRNIAAHSDEISKADALRFRDLARRIRSVLSKVEIAPKP